jgi:hypothetical protein
VFVKDIGNYNGTNPTDSTAQNLAAVINGKVDLDIYGKVPVDKMPMDVQTTTMQGTTGPAPSGGKGTSGGIRVKPSIMGLTDENTLVDGDKLMSIALKTGPDGVTAIPNLYAYVCDNNAQYNYVVVGKSRLFNWPGTTNTNVLVEFHGGVALNPNATYNILFSTVSKNIGDSLASSDCKTLRVPLVPVSSSSDYCCLKNDFNPLPGQQIEMTMEYSRTTVADVQIHKERYDIMESKWSFSPSQIQGYDITMELIKNPTTGGVTAFPKAGGSSIAMSPITLNGNETTLTWNPMGSGITPEWMGNETLTATRTDDKYFYVVGRQTDKKFQPAGDYLGGEVMKSAATTAKTKIEVAANIGEIKNALVEFFTAISQ